MTRSLDDLDSRAKPLFFELLARIVEHGIAIMIIDVMRTEVEQADCLARGVSWTTHSKHLPQPPEGKSQAIDICPYSIYMQHGTNKLNWNDKDPVWQVLGKIGESLGFRWGGRWPKPDSGHFEYVPKPARVPDTVSGP